MTEGLGCFGRAASSPRGWRSGSPANPADAAPPRLAGLAGL